MKSCALAWRGGDEWNPVQLRMSVLLAVLEEQGKAEAPELSRPGRKMAFEEIA
jgi:hypothetical protein